MVLSLKNLVAFTRLLNLLIGVEGTQTPAGSSGKAETPHERSEEEAQRRPAESEVPGTEINSPFKKLNK